MSKSIIVTVDLDEESLASAVERAVTEVAIQRMNDRITTIVGGVAATIVDEEIRASIRGHVETLISEGWNKTDGYGFPTERNRGAKITIAERLNEVLSPSGAYNSRTVGNIVDECIKSMLSNEKEWAIKRFRETVEGVISAKLKESLRDALGLR